MQPKNRTHHGCDIPQTLRDSEKALCFRSLSLLGTNLQPGGNMDLEDGKKINIKIER